MNKQGQGAGGQQGDDSLDFLWVVALIVFASGLVWYFAKDYIISFVFDVRYYEIYIINFFLQIWEKIATTLHLPMPDTTSLSNWTYYLESNPEEVRVSSLVNLSTSVGRYYNIPVALLLIGLGILVYFTHLTLKFKNVFTIPKLRKSEAENWPLMLPSSKVDLVKEDIEKGPWAMAETPMVFAKENDLLEEYVEAGVTKAKIKHGVAQRVFSMQLGAIWPGVDPLPMHVKALYAVFAARANRDTEAADALLDEIAGSSASGKLNFSGVMKLLNKYRNTKLVLMATHRHAYLLTVMASMLELARTDGVLASSQFLWLKPIDRKLWFMLNSIGRQTAVSEVAGPFAHWLAEAHIGRPLRVPMVDQAVSALETALEDILYEPDLEEGGE